MEYDTTHRHSDDMRELLRQMQRTTSLLADRLANTSTCSTPPSASCSSFSVLSPPQSSSCLLPASHLPPSSSLSPTSLLPSSSNPSPLCVRNSTNHYRPPGSTFCPSSMTNREDDIQSNLSRLFRPYSAPLGGSKGMSRKRKKQIPWTHTFVCLPEPGVFAVPNPEEARFFDACGIGKKTITFANNMGDHAYLTEQLYSVFPPLSKAGGYTLAKSDRSKRLGKIPIPTSGYCIEYLRRFVDIRRAPLYILPLQRSLALTPSVVEASAVMERCLSCEKDFPLCDLASHLEMCNKSNEEFEEGPQHCTEEGDEDLALAIYQSLQPMEVQLDESVVVQDEEPQIVFSDDGNIAEEMVSESVVLLSSEHSNEDAAREPDVIAILENISRQLDTRVPPLSNNVNVMRDSVLESALRTFRRQKFSPSHRLNVVFVDVDGLTEGAVDDGGPTREFLRLLVIALKDSMYFNGQEDRKNLSLVSRALDAGEYKNVGQMLSVALIHGGFRPSFFSDRLYCRVSGHPTPQVSIEEVDDWEIREKLQKIKDAQTLQDARDAVVEAAGLLSLLGCSGFVHTLDQRDSLVEEAARAYVEGRTQKALEQLVDGLATLGVAEAIQKHPEEMKALFVGGPKPLAIQDLLDLFMVCYSDPGSNRRRLENQAVMFWKDWLLEVDEGTTQVTLEQILIFASGTDSVPLLGFPHRPTIHFLHAEDGNRRIFPEANTCEVVLRLPLHPSYRGFVEHMESGILQSPTFGFV